MLARAPKSKAKRKAAEPLVATGIRLPARIKNTIDEIAASEHRSFSNLVQLILEEWVQERDAK